LGREVGPAPRRSRKDGLRSPGDEPGSPSQSMIYRWLLAHDDFREKYTFAREVQADTLRGADGTVFHERESGDPPTRRA
jgi:Bacteriophage Sf6, terminase small subunit-like